MNRPIVLAVIAVAALHALPAHARTETRREQSQAVVDGRGLRELVVENTRGEIRVRPSTDGALHVTALKIIHVPLRQRSRDLARETRVETANAGGRYSVRVIYPQHQVIRIGFWDLFRGDLDLPRVELRLALDVPPGVAVTLRTNSGDVDSEGLTGLQAIHTLSGDVQVQSAAGPVVVETSSGDITGASLVAARVRSRSGDISLDGVLGPLLARTSSGDLIVAGARDSLDLATISGDVQVGPAPRGLALTTSSGGIQVENAGGLVRIGTTSGDVEAGFTPGLRAADITSASGGIRTRLARTLGCALDLRTSSGTLDVSLPMQIHTATRRRLAGTVRGGTLPIMLQTTSGDIDVLGGGN